MNLKIFLIIFVQIFLPQKAAAKSNKINFELATINGGKFVSNKNFLGKKTILIFFDVECPPCIEELNSLKEKPPNLNEFNIVIINLSPLKESKVILAYLGLEPSIEILKAPSNSKAFLRKFGNNSGTLPYIALLNRDGYFCLAKSQMFNDQELKNCN